MVGQHSQALTVEICHDGMGEAAAGQLIIPAKGDTGEPSGKQAKGECPFTALSMASLSGADTALLAAALAFILALGLAPVRRTLPRRIHYLRPPLRGPPATA
jgi:hypothetical protein